MYLSIVYHLYFVFIGGLLSYLTTPLVSSCTSVLYILFCWFHASIYMASMPIDFSTGSYCPICRKVTGMGLRHCKFCDKCVPTKWKHCFILERCCDKSLRKRWLILFRIIVVFYGLLTLIYSMMNLKIAVLLPVHAYLLKSTYAKSKRSINNNNTDTK